MILFIQLIWTHLFSFLRAASVNVPCSNIEILLLKDFSVDGIYWPHAFNMVALHILECMSVIILAILCLSQIFFFIFTKSTSFFANNFSAVRKGFQVSCGVFFVFVCLFF